MRFLTKDNLLKLEGFMIPAAIMRDRNIDAAAKMLFGYLQDITFKKGVCLPESSIIEKGCGMTKSQVRRAIKRLKDNGYFG
jgi:hypothetical protein